MIKGCQKRIIHLKNTGSPYFEEAYFILKDECPARGKTKVKVSKWLSQENIKEYQKYLVDWHNLTKAMRNEILSSDDETYKKQTSMLFLQLFFMKPYTSDDFYSEYYLRQDMII